MANRKTKIVSEEQYNATMSEIDVLMKKGEKNLTPKEVEKLRNIAVAAEQYEEVHYPFPKPKTIPEMVELKMFQEKMTQAALAEKLNIGKPKLSQILNGKRPPDVAFLKAAYEILNIDPAFLLEKA